MKQPPEHLDESAESDPPFMAKLVTRVGDVGETNAERSRGEQTIRVGSPFRVDPPPRRAAMVQISGEAAYADYGPFLYTAMGASLSAIVIVVFAAIGCLWFPPGGVIVAILGSALSLVGLFSTKRFRLAAISALPIHVGLFFLSYSRALT